MTTVTVIIVVLVVAALGLAASVMFQRQRRTQLQQRFGPEYTRAVAGADSRREAESHLAGVAQQRDKLDLRDLDEAERIRYTTEWEGIQTRFVDEPAQAVDAAGRLITTVMRERGYPVEDFDQRADLVAADHPEVVAHYREAHAAHERHRSGGSLDTEDLRQSFVHYRALFAVLVEDGKPADLPGAARTDTDRADIVRIEPDQAEPDQAEPDQAEPDQAEPEVTEPDQAGTDQHRTQPTYPQETR